MSSIDLITADPDENSPSTIAAQIDLFVTQLKASIPQFNTVFGEVNTLAANALAAAGALATQVWVSGTSYVVGDVRYSPVNYMSYRRKTNGAGTTDPSSDTTNWALLNRPTAGGALETSSAANITLTENSVRFQHIKMTASGKSVTLPNPASLEEGSPLFVIKNSGTSGQNDYKFFIKDHNGNMVARADLGATILLNVVDSTWSVMCDLNSAKAPLAYATTVLNATSSTTSKIIKLTSTTALILYFSSSNARVAVVTANSNGTLSVGTTTVISGPISSVYDVCALSATECIIAYRTTLNNTAAIVLTISGTTVTAGASPATIDSGNSVAAISLTPISSTRAMVTYFKTTGTGIFSRVLDVSAGVITARTESIGISSYSTPVLSTVYIDSNNILVAYRDTVNTAKVFVATISGTTITEGTGLQVATNGGGLSLNNLGVELLSSSKGVIFFDYNETAVNKDLGYTLFDISGATLSNAKVGCFRGIGIIGKLVVTRLDDYRILLTFKDDTAQASGTQLGDIIALMLRYDNEFIQIEGMAPLTRFYSQTSEYDHTIMSANRMIVYKNDSSTAYSSAAVAEIPTF